MKAAVYDAFHAPLVVGEHADPSPKEHGVVLQVMASGICRSDWHGWQGHDPDIRLPHVPGHEMAGIIVAVGKQVRQFALGQRVTLPFVCGCGSCEPCRNGQQQICDRQSQPGFTHWGSYAEYVAIDYADTNLVALDDSMDFVTAASLGCRFATAYRGVVAQGRIAAGDVLAVHGCGGVGLSAIMIAVALGARVIAIDIDPVRLQLAASIGAAAVVNATEVDDVAAAVLALSDGGAKVSMDALGSLETCRNSILSLRKQGRHVQVGLMLGDYRAPPVPMDKVVANELEIVGSHGMQAHAYGPMLDMIRDGRLKPAQLVAKRVSLNEAAAGFADERYLRGRGVTVIDRFA
ncbi:MAG: zinc-dependent alcohol dehydrogenase family protein [Woeseia sp.]